MMDKNVIFSALLKIGIFNVHALNAMGVDCDELQSTLSSLPDQMVFTCEDGWTVVADEKNMAMNTILRIAGALDISPLPIKDISRALMKMMEWGDIGEGKKGKSSVGKYIADNHENFPSNAAVRFLSQAIGADVSGYGTIDYSTSNLFIRPIGVEKDLLAKLNLTTGGYASISWLSRRLNSRPARTKMDSTIYPSIPFVLRDSKAPVRLVGRNVVVSQKKTRGETFVGMRRSKNGSIVALEYNINEETVESNSFNVSPQCRSIIAGVYNEVNTGKSIKFILGRKDCRKFDAVGTVIRKAYPNYENSETAFVVLDREKGIATIEVGLRYERKFEDRITCVMENGITPRNNATAL